MDLTPYLDMLRADLAVSAKPGGPATVEAADLLSHALEPSARLVLLEALSDAAAEITQDLPHAAVEVRLKGREPQFVVTATEPEMPEPEPAESEPIDDADDTVARITVRIPEGLKTRAEQAAADLGQSLNAWIVQAIRRATRPGGINVDVDLGSMFQSGPPGQPWPSRQSKRMKGWAR